MARAPRHRAARRRAQSIERRRRLEESATVRKARRRPSFDARLPTVLTYREQLLACQLAADIEGVPLAAWIRRTLSAEAGAALRRRGYRVPRRVLDLAAAGRLEQLERLAATLEAGEREQPDTPADQ